MADFSMDLNEDQLQIQKWVHDFAENVVRPAAHEWDETEETPWPIIQQASEIGLYSFDFITQCFLDPTGLTLPIASEELAWGDAGIALSIFGSTLGLAGIAANGTSEQLMEWGPQCFGTPDKIQLAAFAVSEPDAGSDVSSLRTRAVYDEAKDEWVLNGTKTWITNGGIADIHVVVASIDPELGSRGQASFIVPPGTPGISQGQKFQKMGIRASHTAEVVLDDCRIPGSCLLGGKEKLDEKLARAREGKRSTSQAAMKTFEGSRPTVGAQALGHRPSGLRVLPRLRQGAQGFRAGHHREPGHRLQAGRHEDPDRCLPSARLAGRRGWEPGQGVHCRRRLDVQALRRRDGGLGDRAGHPDHGRLRLHP